MKHNSWLGQNCPFTHRSRCKKEKQNENKTIWFVWTRKTVPWNHFSYSPFPSRRIENLAVRFQEETKSERERATERRRIKMREGSGDLRNNKCGHVRHALDSVLLNFAVTLTSIFLEKLRGIAMWQMPSSFGVITEPSNLNGTLRTTTPTKTSRFHLLFDYW